MGSREEEKRGGILERLARYGKITALGLAVIGAIFGLSELAGAGILKFLVAREIEKKGK